MKHKLKHLSRFCCRPNSPIEFEAVKMAAEIGVVNIHFRSNNHGYYFSVYGEYLWQCDDNSIAKGKSDLISVLDFCNKLRMSEEEAEKLEDDRVEFILFKDYLDFSDDSKTLIALNDHYFKTNEDGTEVTLHKRDC